MSRMSWVRSMTVQGSRASTLRAWDGVRSWSNSTRLAPVDATVAMISSSLPPPTRVAGSGRPRRWMRTAAMVAPADRASSWNSASDASKSISTGGSMVGGISGRSSPESPMEASRSEMAAAERACCATLDGRKRSEVNSTATRTALSRDVPCLERRRSRSTASRFALAFDTGLMDTLPCGSSEHRPPEIGGSTS